MDDPGRVVLLGIVSLAVAALVAYVLFRFVSPSERVGSPVRLGRKWCAWGIAVATFTTFPRLVTNPTIDSFAIWVLNVFFWGGLTFLIGWIVGLVREFRKRTAERGASPQHTPLPQEQRQSPLLATEVQHPLAIHDRLKNLDDLLTRGAISKDEYEAQRTRILESL